MLGFDEISGGGNPMKTGQEEFPEASLSDVKKDLER